MRHHAVSRMIVLGFADESAAFELRSLLYNLEDAQMIELGDAVVVTRSAQGKVRLHQSMNLGALYTATGSLSGYVVGMLFLNPLFGSLAGAGLGAVIGKVADHGIPDPFMKELGATLTPGSSALFLAVRKSDPEELLKRLQPFAGKGKLLQTTIPAEDEATLRRFFEGEATAPLPPETNANPTTS